MLKRILLLIGFLFNCSEVFLPTKSIGIFYQNVISVLCCYNRLFKGINRLVKIAKTPYLEFIPICHCTYNATCCTSCHQCILSILINQSVSGSCHKSYPRGSKWMANRQGASPKVKFGQVRCSYLFISEELH